jgi:hypothetical protein
MKEDPTRDPASEARDDHASEPRATPETDCAAWGETDVVEAAFSRRLERQRDELLEALERIARNPGDCDFETGFTSGHIARAAIAAVKGGQP